MAVDGLRRYGYHKDADRIARKFVSLVVDDFTARGAIVEKYDVQHRSSDLAAGLKFGYTTNEVGFGWTNAAILDLLAGLNRRQAAPRAAAGADPQIARSGSSECVPRASCVSR
jgi:alpha,alpha-trehalase